MRLQLPLYYAQQESRVNNSPHPIDVFLLLCHRLHLQFPHGRLDVKDLLPEVADLNVLVGDFLTREINDSTIMMKLKLRRVSFITCT